MKVLKRDWKKVRAVLLALEAADPNHGLCWGQVPGLEDEEALAYFHLLTEAGFVKGHPPEAPMVLQEMTWQGHDLLDTLRHDRFWNGVVDEAKRRGIALTFDAIGQIARHLAQRLLEG